MLTVKIRTKYETATDVCVLELVPETGTSLPEFSAGAHIDVHLPGGFVRQYSLCNSPYERSRYMLGVLRDPNSRGGSQAVHSLKEGDVIRISEPRNNFQLAENQTHAVLVAGGIGITPLLCMAERLLSAKGQFELHYCVRSEDKVAFRERLSKDDIAAHVAFHIDGDPAMQFQPERALPHANPGSHLYVCGPAGFIEWVLKAAEAKGWEASNVHREYFTASNAIEVENLPFEIELASTGEVIPVRADQTAIEALLERDVYIPTSCEQGVCGTCVTAVLDGMPDHRDVFMTDAEHAANDQFTPCCSRGKTRLVIDL